MRINFLTIIFVLVVLYTITAVSQFHKYWLLNTEAHAITSQWQDNAHLDVIVEFAPLPQRDRALVLYSCQEVYQRFKLLRGSKEILAHNFKPGCQALIRSGWHPNWTISDGLSFLRNPSTYIWP